MDQLQIHGLGFLESGRIGNPSFTISWADILGCFFNKKCNLLTDVERNQTLGFDFC